MSQFQFSIFSSTQSSRLLKLIVVQLFVTNMQIPVFCCRIVTEFSVSAYTWIDYGPGRFAAKITDFPFSAYNLNIYNYMAAKHGPICYPFKIQLESYPDQAYIFTLFSLNRSFTAPIHSHFNQYIQYWTNHNKPYAMAPKAAFNSDFVKTTKMAATLWMSKLCNAKLATVLHWHSYSAAHHFGCYL